MFLKFIPKEKFWNNSDIKCITALFLSSEIDFIDPNKWKEVIKSVLLVCKKELKEPKLIKLHLNFVVPQQSDSNILLSMKAIEKSTNSSVIGGLVEEFENRIKKLDGNYFQHLIHGGLVVSICDATTCKSDHEEMQKLAGMLREENEYIKLFIQTGEMPAHIKLMSDLVNLLDL